MKKKWTWIFLCAIPLGSLQAVEILPEIKAGYFYPTDHTFRKIYSGGGMYGLEFSCQAWGRLYPWIAASYFSESGHSIGQKNRTIVTLVPLEVGLKYLFPVSTHARMYVGFGAAPTYLNTQDHSRYVIESVHKWGLGGIVKAGAIVNFGRFFFDFYGNYSFTKISFDNTHGGRVVRHDADVSGLTFGAGIGYRLGGPMKRSKARTSAQPSVFIEGSATVPQNLENTNIVQEPCDSQTENAIQNDDQNVEVSIEDSLEDSTNLAH